MSPDGSRIVTASRNTLQIWDSGHDEALLTLSAAEPVEALAFSLDGKRLLALTSAGVRAWDSGPPSAPAR